MSQQICRWVKASERLPDNDKLVHIKTLTEIGAAKLWSYDGKWYWQNTLSVQSDLNNLEWLDEQYSAEPGNVEGDGQDELWRQVRALQRQRHSADRIK